MQSVSANQEVTVWRDTSSTWILFSLCVLLIGYVFYDGLLEMVTIWNDKEEYGHGYLIPVISLFLIWQKKDVLEKMPLEGSWFGAVLVLFGIICFFLGELSTLYIVIQYSFLLVIYGLLFAFLGFRGVRVIWAPLLFLIFMIPLPNFLYQGLSAQLQLISSELGVAVIRLIGIGVYLEGNVIDLGSYKLQVVEACSGLRYLFPLMSLAFLMAYLFKASVWKRVLVFLSSIPITILMNSFRIGVIGILVEYWGPSMAEGFLHDFEGWIVFMACLGILLLEIWILTHFIGTRIKFADAFGIDFPEDSPADAKFLFRKLPVPMVASVVVLSLGIITSMSLGKREEVIPERMSFADFPMELGEWSGKEDRLQPIILDVLKLDDYIIADFVSSQRSGVVNFYSAYYISQVKGESAHSPRSCLPGGGWQITDLAEKRLEGLEISGNPLVVNRVVIKKGEYTQLVYYWFQQRGRIITNEYLVKWYLFLDALLDTRTDGALVRFTTLVNPGEDIDKGDERLLSLVKEVSSVLQRHIPE